MSPAPGAPLRGEARRKLFVLAFRSRLRELSPYFQAEPKVQGGSLFRIHANRRSRPELPPYKEQTGVQFRHTGGGDVHAPGFYLHLEPDGPDQRRPHPRPGGAGQRRPQGQRQERARQQEGGGASEPSEPSEGERLERQHREDQVREVLGGDERGHRSSKARRPTPSRNGASSPGTV